MMLELDKIYNMDCIEGMKQIDTDSIHLVLTDPPYGTNVMTRKRVLSRPKNKAKIRDYGEVNWDIKPSKKYFDEIFRISKNQIIFGGNYFLLPPSSCWIVWDKCNGNSDFADCELAWTSFDTAIRKIELPYATCKYWNSNYFERRFHPTQKPTELFRWILNKYSKKDEIVCDPFCGSGSVLLACKQLKKKYIGFEINSNYIKICKDRLKQECIN